MLNNSKHTEQSHYEESNGVIRESAVKTQTKSLPISINCAVTLFNPHEYFFDTLWKIWIQRSLPESFTPEKRVLLSWHTRRGQHVKHITFKTGGESSRPKLSLISHNVFRTQSSTELLTNNQHPVAQQHHVMFHSYKEQQADSAICDVTWSYSSWLVCINMCVHMRMWVNDSSLITIKELLPSLSIVSDQRALLHSHLTQVSWNVPSNLESNSAADGAAWNKTGLLWCQSEWRTCSERWSDRRS